jgi:hypothetical protein
VKELLETTSVLSDLHSVGLVAWLVQTLGSLKHWMQGLA